MNAEAALVEIPMSNYPACFTTGISTPPSLLFHVTLRRFCSGRLASGSTSPQGRLG
jgi:hypothetical protein